MHVSQEKCRPRESESWYLVTTLNEIISEPRRGEYVQQICVSHSADMWKQACLYEDPDERKKQTRNSSDLLQSLVKLLPHVAGAEFSHFLPSREVDYWIKRIQNGG